MANSRRRWTDEQLRDAVATSKSWLAVMRALDLKGGNHHVSRRARALGLDISHFTSRPDDGRSSHDDELTAAVASYSSYHAVVAALNQQDLPDAEIKIRRRVKVLGLDTSHFSRVRKAERGRARRWSDDALREAVASSRSYAAVIRRLGLIPAGGNYDHVQRQIERLALDTSHFTGAGWNVGRKFNPIPPVPIEEVLVAGRWMSSHALKKRLIRAGLKKAACEICGWAERALDGRIPVELDHINGDKNDNRIENLRVLCPNCHSLQPTHRGLNQKRRR